MSNLGTGVRTLWTADGPDFDPYRRRVSGAAAVGEAVLRRFYTDRGALAWAPDVGFDIRRLLNASIRIDTRSDLQHIENAVRAEATADERVRSADVVATYELGTRVLTIEVALQTAEGPFRFVLAVTSLTVRVLRAG